MSTEPNARNIGLKIAKGKYALFTDADCIAHKDWLKTMIECLESQDVAAIGGRIERYKPLTLVQKYGSNIVNGQKTLNYLPILKYPYIVGANSGFRKDILTSVGGFDNNLLSGNDVDACYKIGLSGYKIGLASEAIIYHENRKYIADHFKRFYTYSRYQVLLFKKYRSISKKHFIFNPYPSRLILKSLLLMPLGMMNLFRLKPKVFFVTLFNIIEALGIILGNIHGAFEHRVFYL